MKRLIFDLDGTVAIDDPSLDYAERAPNWPLVEKIREYRRQGFAIVIASARNMRSFGGQIGRINAVTLPQMVRWLDQHDIPYDEIYVGKPWCGPEGFYVDDRAVRPSEFVDLSRDEIHALLRRERGVLPAADREVGSDVSGPEP
jgi:capsule biosynthesis phosphatase